MRKQGWISLVAGFLFGLILFFGPGLIPVVGNLTESLSQAVSRYSGNLLAPYVTSYVFLVLAAYLLYAFFLSIFVLVVGVGDKLKVLLKNSLFFFVGLVVAFLLALGAAMVAASRFKGF